MPLLLNTWEVATHYATRTKWTADHQQLLNAVAEDQILQSKSGVQLMSLGHSFSCASRWHSVVTLKVEKVLEGTSRGRCHCSGLQLLSAMRRDPVGMKYVNLLPESEADDPQDHICKCYGLLNRWQLKLLITLICSHT